MNRRRTLPALLSAAGLALATALPAQVPSATDVLASEKQEAIWEAEHRTFLIETRFGKPFLEALGQVAPEGPDVVNQWFVDPLLLSHSKPAGVERREVSGFSESIQRFGNFKAEGVDDQSSAQPVPTRLAAAAHTFSSIKSASLRVLAISAIADSPGWDTTILLTLAGPALNGVRQQYESKHKVRFRSATKESLSKGPCIDHWLFLEERWSSAPGIAMEEVTEAWDLHELPLSDNWNFAAGTRPLRYPHQIAVEDFDRDGFLDLAVATIQGSTVLMRSVEGERFEIVTESFGVAPNSTRKGRPLATWIDFSNDGWPDLILGDRVYRNENGKGFTEITSTSGLYFPQLPMGAVVADYDNDGWPDLYVVYQFSSETGQRQDSMPWVGDDFSGATNALWRNLGNGRFEEVTFASRSGAGMRNTHAAAWLHADGDLLPDLYVANDFGKNNLLRNLGDGRFEEIAGPLGVADFATSMGVAVGDLDNDGSTELYVANMYSKMGRRIIGGVSRDDYGPGIYEQIVGACAGNRLYRLGDSGSYEEHSEDWGINDVGWAYAPAMADLNQDGFLDLYATAGFMSFERGKPDG